jgi:hypothetical protein
MLTTMVRLQTKLIALSIFVTCFHSVSGQENGEETPQTIENPSPNGRFAFRNTGDSDSEKQTYDLIDKGSGKVLKSVAESDPDLGSSARFNMSVLWRSDSKAFALTATLIKLGSEVSVYLQEGTTFRKIKLPKLSADIPEKIKRGKSFPHVSELDSWSAKQWQKDGSLVVEIENMVDGNDGSITATRTVVLGFDRSDKAKVLKSTINLRSRSPNRNVLWLVSFLLNCHAKTLGLTTARILSDI